MADKDLTRTVDQLLLENEELRSRLTEAEEALSAIRNGEVDAIVVSGKEGDKVFSISSAETPYRIMLEEMEEGALSTSTDGTIIYCNERFAGLLSVPRETILGSRIETYVTDDARHHLLKLLKKSNKSRAEKVIPFLNNGNKIPVNLKLSASKLPEGMSGEICIIASNVSGLIQYQEKLEEQVEIRTIKLKRANLKLKEDLAEIKRSRKALQESNYRLSTLYNSMSEGLAVHEMIYDKSGKPTDYLFVDVNPAFEMITRLKKKKTLGRKATEVFALNEAPYIETYSEVAIKGEEVSFETYFPPMKKHFSIAVFSPGKGKFATIFSDITERKLSEEELSKNEKLLKSVLDNVNSGVALIDETGRFLIYNPLFLKLFGLSEDLTIKNVNDQNWAEWQVFNEDGTLLHVDDHPVRKAAMTGKHIDQQLVGVKLPSGGEIIWMLITAEPILKANGDIEKIICTYNDITARRNVEQLLKESERKLSLVQENMSEGLMIFDADGNVIYQNPASLRLHGFRPGESEYIENRELSVSWTGWDERGRLLGFEEWPVSRVIRGEHFQDQVLRSRRNDTGHEFFASYNGCPIFNDNGRIAFAFITIRDITRHRMAEDALRLSEERFRLALKNAPVSVAIQDVNLVYTWAYNQKTHTPVEIIGKTDEDLFAPEDMEWITPLKKSLLVSGKDMYVEKWLTSRGKRLFLGIHYEVIRDTSGAVTAIGAATIDLTERKLMEEALRKSEQQYRYIVETANEGIWVLDSETKTTYVNEKMARMLGYLPEDMLERSYTDFMDPEDRSHTEEEFRLRQKEIEGMHEQKLVCKDGSVIWVLSNTTPMIDKDGRFHGSLGMLLDITGRKKMEDKLRESEGRFRNLVKYAPTAIYEIDFITRKLTSATDEMCKLSGYSREELLSIDALDLLAEDSKKLFLERISKFNKGEITGEDVEYKVKSKDGRIIDAVLNMKLSFNEKGIPVGAMVVGHDITQRKRAVEELQKTGKALKENEAKLKELIATKDKFFNIIAHDLKNPFTSLIGSSELLLENINTLSLADIKELASILNDSSKNGFSILQNLLDWSRSQTGLLKISPQGVNLRELIADNIFNLQLSANNKDITITNELAEDINMITDINMINSILRNLLSNAIKFTPRSGNIVVDVKKETHCISLIVKDSGVGISPDRIGNLFKLDTKNSSLGTENEQGTGLGLKLSKEFIEKLGGNISVKSVLGQGSTFRIKFPVNLKTST